MLRLLIYFLIPAFFMLAPGCLRAERALHFLEADLDIQGSSAPIVSFVACDCDGDGWDEMLAWGHPQTGTTDVLQMWEFDGALFIPARQWPFHDGRVFNCLVSDLDGDGRPEIILARVGRDAIWLEIAVADSPCVVSSSPRVNVPDLDREGGWDGHFLVRDVADMDGDGTDDIICSCAAGYDLEPRGIMVFSGATLNVLGTYETAGPVHRVKACSLGDPARPVILIEAGSSSNGRVVGRFTDNEMYLLAVDSNLSLLWHVRVGGPGTRWDFDLADMDDDGVRDVVMSRRFKRGSEADDYLLELRDIVSGEIKRTRSLTSNAGSVTAADLDRDTKPEIVATLTDGRILVFNRSLEPLYSHKEDAILHTLLVDDIDLDGEPDLVVRRGNVALMVFTPELEVRTSRDFGSQVNQVGATRVSPDRNYLQASVESGQELKHIRLLTNKPGNGLFLLAAIATPVGYFVFRLSVGGLRRGKNKRERPAEDGGDGHRRSQLLTLLSGFRHSDVAQANLQRLAWYCQAKIGPSDHRYAEHRSRLAGIIETYNDFTRGQLARIADACAKIDGGPYLAEFRERIVDLNRSMDGMSGQRLPIDAGEDAAGRIARDIRAVQRLATTLRDRVLTSYHTDVAAVLCRAVATLRERLGELGAEQVAITIEGEGYARVDADTLKQVLEILLVNAAEAMAQAESRELQVTQKVVGPQIIVTVKDTGCGIPKERWDKIFERGETTKGSGRGLGLSQARDVLARYDGLVRVDESTPNNGTTMTLRLWASPSRVATGPGKQTEGTQK